MIRECKTLTGKVDIPLDGNTSLMFPFILPSRKVLHERSIHGWSSSNFVRSRGIDVGKSLSGK